jgi:hypothetical protein
MAKKKATTQLLIDGIINDEHELTVEEFTNNVIAEICTRAKIEKTDILSKHLRMWHAKRIEKNKNCARSILMYAAKLSRFKCKPIEYIEDAIFVAYDKVWLDIKVDWVDNANKIDAKETNANSQTDSFYEGFLKSIQDAGK